MNWKIITPWMLLAASVALNAFFLGGFLHARDVAGRFMMGDDRRMDHISENLDLSPEQQRGLEGVFDGERRDRDTLHEEMSAIRQQFETLAESETPSTEAFSNLLAAMESPHLAMSVERRERLVAFFDTLNPEQRRELLEQITRDHGRFGGRSGRRGGHGPWGS